MSGTSERRPRRKFTGGFKADAVAMVEESGGQIAKVAKELGIYDSSLGNWVRQAREEAAGAPTAAEREEIRELKKNSSGSSAKGTFWEKQPPTSRHETRGTGDGDLLVDRRGAGQPGVAGR